MKESKKIKKAPKLRELESFKIEDRKDIEAVQAVLSGNKEQYKRILERYRPFLYQRIYLKVKDRATAEDITSDVLCRVYERLNKYQMSYTFNAWFYMVADNYLIDWARKNDRPDRKMMSYDKVGINDEGDSMPVAEEIMKDGETATDAAALSKERTAALNEALSQLDETGRMLIDMFYNKEMRYEEMAERTGLQVNTMKVILFRAKKKLAEYFQRAYPEFKMQALDSKNFSSVKSEEVNIGDGETQTVYYG
jgi:RNA polymerase sigma-70 factor (ECF subfamily)